LKGLKGRSFCPFQKKREEVLEQRLFHEEWGRRRRPERKDRPRGKPPIWEAKRGRKGN